MKNFFKKLKEGSKFINSNFCTICNNQNSFKLKSGGGAIPHLIIDVELVENEKKVRRFFISEKENKVENTNLIKNNNQVNLFISSKNTTLAVTFQLDNDIHLQLLLSIFLGKKVIIEFKSLGLDYNRMIATPNLIEGAKQSFLDFMLYKAMIPKSRVLYPKLTDDEIELVLKENPEEKEVFYRKLISFYS